MLITNKQLRDKILNELIEAYKEFSPTVLHPILIGAFIRVLKENLPDEESIPVKWKCTLCGRVMDSKTPHYCSVNFRKRHIDWQPQFEEDLK